MYEVVVAIFLLQDKYLASDCNILCKWVNKMPKMGPDEKQRAQHIETELKILGTMCTVHSNIGFGTSGMVSYRNESRVVKCDLFPRFRARRVTDIALEVGCSKPNALKYLESLKQ